MHGQLLPTGGGDPIPLLSTKLLVGRRDSCDIVLSYPNVSSQHAVLELMNGYWQIRNLSNSNGTKVNGERVLERFLQPGDTICFAKHCFEISYTPDPTAPPPQEDKDPFALSLLEKAGLSSGERRPPSRPKPTPQPPKPLPKKNPEEMDDHDRALEWLTADDEPPKMVTPE